MKLGVTGCRKFFNYTVIEAVLNAIHKETPITFIIEGGQSGVDELAKGWAIMNGVDRDTEKANWTEYGNAAGPIRNQKIVDKADKVIAFWDGESKGTKDTITKARKQNKLMKVVLVDIDNTPHPIMIEHAQKSQRILAMIDAMNEVVSFGSEQIENEELNSHGMEIKNFGIATANALRKLYELENEKSSSTS